MAENGSGISQLRNARACEACRASKSRCFFRNQQDICQKCDQNGNQCIVRTKARPLRTKSARPRPGTAVDQVIGTSEPEFVCNLPAITASDTCADAEELFEHHKTMFGDDNLREEDDAGPTVARVPVLSRRKVDCKEAEQLLLAFRSKAPFFPFVHVPSNATAPSLARTSPFLLLAILTAASLSDPKLYHQMDHEFRRILSSKVIVEGQKSLDYLQGMLVYIAWYPMHSKPKNNQAFMYMNVAISMAVDLGLDQPYPNMNVFSAFSTTGLIENSLFTLAGKRAYLGCYYLSSALSLGAQKPDNMHYRNLMDDQGEALLQQESSGGFSSSDIISLVKLQHLTERIRQVHLAKQAGMNEYQDGSLIAEMNVQMFLCELDEWRKITSSEVRNLPFISLAECFANITIYSQKLGFLRRPYRDHLGVVETTSSANQTHLYSCLEACKRFFECLISIPETTYRDFTAAQWAAVVQSTLVLSRLTFLMASNLSWTPETTRANIPMVMYLDALCYRFQAVSSTSTPPALQTPRPQDPDMFYVFKLILSSVKRSYERRVASIVPRSSAVETTKAVGPARGHCPMLDPNLAVYLDDGLEMEYDSTYGGSWGFNGERTPASSSTTSQVPVYFDLWATMTGNWAEEI